MQRVPARSCTVTTMNAQQQDAWDEAIRTHDHRVFVSLLALGLPPERAREVAQAAWTRLIEQHGAGKLGELSFPGLAIKQARFLALSEMRKQTSERRLLEAVPNEQSDDAGDLERRTIQKQSLDRALSALDECPKNAQRVFRLIYTPPHLSHADTAREMGLSLQRVRQILCETRKVLRDAMEDVR